MIAAILLFPLIGFLINGLFSKHLSKVAVSIIGCGSVFLSFAIAFYIFVQFLEAPASWRVMSTTLFTWIPQLGVNFSLKLDVLSILLVLVITGVGFLIHLYSINYMESDPGFGRYFAYLNLFTCSMLLLVLANNLLLLFIGWEGVGLCSYLLIGFWFEDDKKAQAGKKAFLVNRIGDFAFLIGLFLTFLTFGTLNIESLSIFDFNSNHHAALSWISLLFFIGACGKSAQIPLYVWLPDAMAGPTPVSALIHAATMVTAGVYMIARLHFIYLQTPLIMTLVATTGALTMLFAASMAFFQNDIKKVLAYSTISQLGYMFLAVGVGAFSAGIFHLMTHAFFKALLFLAAGSVIYSLHHEQDIQKMGGLHKKLPLTHIVFLFGTLAIIGMPPFSGFFSKDEILWMAFNRSPLFWFLGWLGALMTTFYMVRLFTLTFYSKSKLDEKKHLHEAPVFMALSLIILSLLSLGGGFISIPHSLHSLIHVDNFLEQFLGPLFSTASNTAATLTPHASLTTEYILMTITTLSSLLVAGTTFFVFHKKQQYLSYMKFKHLKWHRLLSNKYYIDEIYLKYIITPIKVTADVFWKAIDIKIIDGFFNGAALTAQSVGSFLSRIQSGNLQSYAFYFVLGVVFILIYTWF